MLSRDNVRVPMALFTEFVGAPPSSKVASVQRFKDTVQPYDARTDYYKQLREFIPKNHRKGGSTRDLLNFAASAAPRKAANYGSRAGAYARWWDGRKVKWTGPRQFAWESGSVEVSVNPEVVAAFDGVPHAVKLYFKKEHFSVDRANVTLRLLELAYGGSRSDRVLVVLDLAHDQVFESQESLAALDPYLAGEAASFAAMVRAL